MRQASRQHCCWDACQISEWLEKFKQASHDFENSRDLVVRMSIHLVNKSPGSCSNMKPPWGSCNRSWRNWNLNTKMTWQDWKPRWKHRVSADGYLNSLRPSDVIWRRGSRSTLAQVMACCLTAPSHYLNQCWLIISIVRSSVIHLSAMSQEIPQPPSTKISLKIIYLKLHSKLLGANELTHWPLEDVVEISKV